MYVDFFLFLGANYPLQASKMQCLRKQNHRLRSQNLLNGNTPKVPSIPEQEIRQSWPETQQLLIRLREWSLTSIIVPHASSKKLGTFAMSSQTKSPTPISKSPKWKHSQGSIDTGTGNTTVVTGNTTVVDTTARVEPDFNNCSARLV